MISKEFKIIDVLGIHARPASALVSVASKFKSEIKISHNDKTGNAKSIMSIMSLAIKSGNEITITFEGEDEDVAAEEVALVLKNEGLV